MAGNEIMERGLELLFAGAVLFLLFVTAMVWRAAVQMRILRRRLEEMRRTVRRQETREMEPVSGADDWVPRR